ncbi:hypothetical protein [Burkholderia sp. Nafp2/4-1b]|uniref:hypothetical protein n=1 Tax=Burkholderia sp. Nafp2/4-1b TaxID=2116686 RepID=UPI0013CE7712|nr:hypothetical protein [Burkholderia sp. Nafp2/4-1b]
MVRNLRKIGSLRQVAAILFLSPVMFGIQAALIGKRYAALSIEGMLALLATQFLLSVLLAILVVDGIRSAWNWHSERKKLSQSFAIRHTPINESEEERCRREREAQSWMWFGPF